jgi:hypothetical protein
MYPFGHLFLAGLAGVLCFSLNSVFAAEAQAPQPPACHARPRRKASGLKSWWDNGIRIIFREPSDAL